MNKVEHVITYDVGTTGVKTCLFEITDKIRMIDDSYGGYNLYLLENGGAEQDPDEWWQAICDTTKDVLLKSGISRDQVSAVSFCSQMQGLVLVDKDGNPIRNAMSYMDNRASKQYKDGFTKGLSVAGYNIRKILTFLRFTKAAPISTKDPVWRYKWVEENEPENFAKVDKWLDVKDYLVCRFTGEKTMTAGSAYSTFLYDSREGKKNWSKKLCDLLGVNIHHMPKIIEPYERAGGITSNAAAELGLKEGTSVFSGGGDAELIGVGAGAVEAGETHVYMGTSGWISTVTEKQVVDPSSSIAAIVGANPKYFHYFAEMETAGKCLEWVKDHLALDEIDVYLEKKHVAESMDSIHKSLYDYLCEVVSTVPAGSGGLIFTPWLHGNRCPFEDPNARGVFFNIGIETGKSEMIRSVIEGIGYHCRMMMEASEKKVKTSDTIIFCGGSAASPVISQILADILGHRIAVLPNPQNVGAFGAAILIAKAMDRIPSIESAKDLLPEYTYYEPNSADKAAHEKNYQVFSKLHKANKAFFSELNSNQ